MAIKAEEVRSAREFLRKRGVKGVSPRKFARSSQELGVNYRALLDILAGVAKANGNITDGVRQTAK